MAPLLNATDLMLHPLVFRETPPKCRLAIWVETFYDITGSRVNDFLRFLTDTANPGYTRPGGAVKMGINTHEQYLPHMKHP